MIVGTAGHIDHGKTTLVRALTGVDTDRLPEEKKRGISIELGYAFLDLPDHSARIGFIDVPGHERLVHTMLAGATGIDHALLLVAADDGVMPQTREHLAVLSLLGLSRGTVAVTKCDRVDAERVAQVCDEVRALLADTPLAGSPVLPVSALSGEGLPALRQRLFDAAAAAPAAERLDVGFRLAVDRAFTLDGVGTVVTGTVHAGQVSVGDELQVVPSTPGGSSTGLARVRSLHAQNQVVAQAHAGQRCAIAVVGLAKDQVSRGQWLVSPDVAFGSERFDARLTLWHGEAKALRSGTPVHVHVGAADGLGTVAVLQVPDEAGSDAMSTKADAPADSSFAPGAQALVQIVLRKPMGVWRGDRVVLRDASGSRTLAGGEVLDPLAPARYRRTPQRLAELLAWQLNDDAQRLAQLLAASPQGLDLRRWARAEGLLARAQPALPPDTRLTDDAAAQWALAEPHERTLQEAIVETLKRFHADHPEELGPDAARLRRLTAPRLPEPLWRALLVALQSVGRLARRGSFVHLPEHGLRLSATDERIAQKVAPLLTNAGFEGAWARDLARDARESEVLMRTTLVRLSQGGELHQIVKDLFYSPAAVSKLAAIARDLARQNASGEVSAAAFRDATGLGRKRAIQLLEHFDRVGLLRRVGDVHRLRSDTALFMQDTA